VADASYDYDWEVIPGRELAIIHEGGFQVARAAMTDAHGAPPLGLGVGLTASAAFDPPDDDYVLIELLIKNTTENAVEGIFAGLYMDWDSGNLFQNEGGYAAAERIGYLTDPAHPESTHVGLVSIDPLVATSFRFIHNPTYVHPNDEIRDEDAFGFMSSGVIDHTTFEANDWSMVLANGPFTLAPLDSARFAMAIVAGEGLLDLKANAQQARSSHGPTSVAWGEVLPARYDLGRPFPNPFNPAVSFTLNVPAPGGPVSVRVYDLRGRLVACILEGTVLPGRHQLNWQGQDQAECPVASGIYLFRLVAGDVLRIRKGLLLR
jgi:hypothetical protein